MIVTITFSIRKPNNPHSQRQLVSVGPQGEPKSVDWSCRRAGLSLNGDQWRGRLAPTSTAGVAVEAC